MLVLLKKNFSGLFLLLKKSRNKPWLPGQQVFSTRRTSIASEYIWGFAESILAATFFCTQSAVSKILCYKVLWNTLSIKKYDTEPNSVLFVLYRNETYPCVHHDFIFIYFFNLFVGQLAVAWLINSKLKEWLHGAEKGQVCLPGFHWNIASSQTVPTRERIQHKLCW